MRQHGGRRATATLPAVRVGLVAVPETAPAVLYSLYEVFDAAGRAWEAITGEVTPARRMEPIVVAAERTPFPCSVGITLNPDAAFADVTPVDLVVVPDVAVSPLEDPRGRWPAATAWLRRQHAAGAVIGSVCTGSLLLAEAGLLDGVEATTHWSVNTLFERHYPAVQLRSERILVPAGHEHRVVTSGGFASWAELSLYLVARFSGREEAVRLARIFLLGDRSDGQLPFEALLRPSRHSDAAIERCQAWIAYHYGEPNPVAAMTRLAGLSPRTFKRRFRAATGYTAIEYVRSLRVEEAKHLLETTPAPVDEIAAEVGYQDPASFRRLFRQMTGVTPARYRQRFAGIGAPVTP